MSLLHGRFKGRLLGRDRRWHVAKYAVISRLASLVLGVVSNAIIDDYDSSVLTILPPAPPASSPMQKMARALAQVYVRWDSFYFLDIAQNGYVFEQEHAFFPLVPLLMRLLASTVLAPLNAMAGQQLTLAAAGIIVSNVSFVMAAVTLYSLGCCTLHNERLAYIAALLFVVAPSNMFMSAIYTESLFAWLVFTAMLLVAQRKYAWASVWLSASSLCRSNGVCYAGFFVWDIVVKSDAWNPRSGLAVRTRAGSLAKQAAKAAALAVASSLGFAAFQAYGYWQFCQHPSFLYGAQAARPYCSSWLPSVYGFVQGEYWDVGFLRYYTWRQIPNFLIAMPMIVLSAAGVCTYMAHDPLRIATLGWICGRTDTRAPADQQQPDNASSRHSSTPSGAHIQTAYFSDSLLPHIYLWGLLLVMATTTMHVQVITRFFSSMPAVFWFAAHVVAGAGRPAWHRWAIVCYFVGYGLVGVVLFSNFFPPA